MLTATAEMWGHFLMKTPLCFLWMVVLLDLVTTFFSSLFLVSVTPIDLLMALLFFWALLTSAFEIFAHFSPIMIVPVDSSIISGAQVPGLHWIMWLFPCCSAQSSYSLQQDISEQGAPNLFCCPFNFFLPPTTALELPPSILCFLAIFSSCHFSTWNPLLLSIQSF